MDNLTHGLLGLALSGLHRPTAAAAAGADGPIPANAATERAVVWASVLAAELPDLDVFYGTGDPLGEFKYHRGLTHSFLLAPLVAAVATGIIKVFFRKARMGPVYAFSLLSVLLAHITADLWTGWGTMALLPFDPVRLGLDWVSIVDPLIWAILGVAAVFSLRRPAARRRILTGALVLTLAYVGVRGTIHTLLAQRVAARYPDAARVEVWPGFNPVGAWDYAVQRGDRYIAGTIGVTGSLREGRQMAAPDRSDPLVAAALNAPNLAPLFRFTAFPLVTAETQPDGTARVTVSDLKSGYFRYNISIDAAGHVASVEAPRHGF